MGLFDGLLGKKTAQPKQTEAQPAVESVEDVVEEEPSTDESAASESFDIESAEVIERDARPEPVPEKPAYEPTPLKSYAEKAPVTHVIGQTQIVAVINQKGGVGKSTTAINLAAALGSLNKQVLLVDLDPQGNSSSGLGIEKSQVNYCIYDVLLNDIQIEDVIIPDVCKGVDVAPATINLAGAEVELVSEMARENRLKDAVGSLRGKYDYVFVDCPPSLGLLTVNALVAADKLLIPIQCEFYALEGVTKLLDSMKRVKTRLNPTLDVFGVLMTMYDGRTVLARQVVEEVRGYFGKVVFDTLIPRTVKLSEAPSFGMPVVEYDPNGKGAKAYMALAKEVIDRG